MLSLKRQQSLKSISIHYFLLFNTNCTDLCILNRCILHLNSVKTHTCQVSSVEFSLLVVSDSLRHHELQHARPPCPSRRPLKPMSESVMPSNHLILCHPLLLLPSIFPASGSFQMSQLFTSGGQSIGVSASTSVLSMNTQDCLL